MSARRRAGVAGAVLAVAAAGAVAGLDGSAGGGDPGGTAGAAAAVSAGTARVERGALVARETVTGTLGRAAAGTFVAAGAGVVTAPPREGAVVRRGHSLLEVDGRRTGWVLEGARPAWRDLGPGIDAGADVRQLERELRRLGHDPDRALRVDGEWTAATTAAVRRFQAARDLPRTGRLARGEVVFRPGGAVRVGTVAVERGTALRPGQTIAELTGTRRVVTVDLPADRQSLARRGARVRVVLPDGRRATGRVAGVAPVATPPKGDDGETTVAVTVGLAGAAARGRGMDAAPVEVGLVSERAEGVLHVPVTAVLATVDGGYAVEVPGRGRVPVALGLEADGRVAVRGNLRAGDRVVVPA